MASGNNVSANLLHNESKAKSDVRPPPRHHQQRSSAPPSRTGLLPSETSHEGPVFIMAPNGTTSRKSKIACPLIHYGQS
jgi:hypothetical protein